MKKAGVIGDPIGHSLSPLIHGYWIEHYGIEGEYLAHRVPSQGLSSFLQTALRDGYAGFNVTIPHKEAVFTHVDVDDPYALSMGSVNTVYRRDGRWWGMNSDGFGFLEHLKTSLSAPSLERIKRVLILGAGGACRGIVGALVQLPLSDVGICARNGAKAEAVVQVLKAYCGQGGAGTVRLEAFSFSDFEERCGAYDLIVNATPLGMVGFGPLDLPFHHLSPNAIFYDLVYTPLETEFLRHGREQGHIIVDGLGMLLHQARVGFEKWFGIWPEVDEALSKTVRAKLQR